MPDRRRILGFALLLAPLALAAGCFDRGGTAPAANASPKSADSKAHPTNSGAPGITTPGDTDTQGGKPDAKSGAMRGPQPKKGSDQAVSVTPDQAIDPKSLTDVVKEEVKGGESTSAAGPTPLNYLWLPADVSLVKDEPMTVAPPLGLEPIMGKVPLANPMTKKKVELGKQLYFDARISKDGTVSCATCHNPEKGWTDNLRGSIGINGQVGSRNSPTVLNTVYGRTMFWDGRAPSLEGQAQGPVQNKIEMGDQSYKEIIERLRTIPGYRESFKVVFGTDVTLDGVAKAIAAFERTALSGNSAYDRYERQADPDKPETFKVLSDSAKRGMVLFGLRLNPDDPFRPGVALKKANCTSCHAGSNFSDEQFHNLGVGWSEKERKFADLGRFVIEPVGAKNTADIGAFKTPTVRDIVKTAPYMHDGSEKTLLEIVEFYDKGGNPNPTLDTQMRPLKLTAGEKADLVEFMKALTGEATAVALPTLPAGPDGKSPDPRAALTPPGPKASASTSAGDVHAAIGH